MKAGGANGAWLGNKKHGTEAEPPGRGLPCIATSTEVGD